MAHRSPPAFRSLASAALLLALAPACASTATQGPRAPSSASGSLRNLVQYVNPLIGTAAALEKNAVENGAGGSVFPGATVPFGMVQWSPDTPNARPSGYDYADREIEGFSLTHFSGAGCPNNEDLPILPVLRGGTGPQRFTHAKEHASAGYYEVTLESGVRVELTAALRSGVGRFTFPRGQGDVLVGPVKDGSVRTGRRVLSGYTTGGPFCQNSQATYRLYFYATFSRDFAATRASAGTLRLAFDSGSTPVVMRVGVSYVSVENAKANLEADGASTPFDDARAAAAAAWNERLNAIHVEGGTDAEKTKLYTALYRTLIHPNVFNDSNGDYLGFDGRTRRVQGRKQYANFSSWDTYRSHMQLLALLFPDETSDIAQSLVQDAAECGYLPLWSHNNIDYKVMVGDPTAILIANAHAFGARKFDARAALATILSPPNDANSRCGYPDVLVSSFYTELGYLVPTDVHNGKNWGAASTTLEYAARDFAAAQLARALDDETNARVLLGRAGAWRNVFEDGGLVQSRLEDGSWRQPLNAPAEGYNKDYVEGNAEQYTWMVPFEASTLVNVLGGPEVVVPRLDRFFSRLNAGGKDPNFYMGNEPSFGTPWLYNWAGAPSRTEDVVRRIVDQAFGTKPDGLPGNDDLGALSSWLVWAMLGVYPAVPGVAGFATAAPAFPEARVHRTGGRVIELKRSGTGHVRALRANGAPLTGPWLDFDPAQSSLTLEFELAADTRGWPGAGFAPFSSSNVFASFNDALNARGVGKDAQSTQADFDGRGSSYSSQALAAAGLRPSAPIAAESGSPVWPSGELDNVVCAGQTIQLAAPVRARRWVVLGAANHGPSRGSFVFTSADGSQRTVEVELPDWTLNDERDAVPAGVRVVAKLPYRLDRAGNRETTPTYVFATTVDFGESVEVASVTLPARVSRGRLHLFAHSLVSEPPR